MTVFTIELAGCVIGVEAGYESTRAFCREYISAKKPQLRVAVTSADLERERTMVYQQEEREGLLHQEHSLPELELLALHRNITEGLFGQDILMFHGSCIGVDGAAYLFTAKSGTGKSTHTRLWRQMLGDRAVMINDDKPMLRMTGAQVLAYGTPWNGKHRLSTNTSLPLRAICLLERGEENSIQPISVREALVELLQQSSHPQDPGLMPKYMELLDKLARGVRFYRLRCNMEPEAARVSFEAMSSSPGLSDI